LYPFYNATCETEEQGLVQYSWPVLDKVCYSRAIIKLVPGSSDVKENVVTSLLVPSGSAVLNSVWVSSSFWLAHHIRSCVAMSKGRRKWRRRRWENNIKWMGRYNNVEWLCLIQGSDKWRAYVNTVTNCRDSLNVGNFLTNWGLSDAQEEPCCIEL